MVSAYNNWDKPAAQSLVWFENDGRMQFTLRTLANAPTHLITLGVGDVTGDGRPDLVTGGMHTSRPYDRMSRVTVWTDWWRKTRKARRDSKPRAVSWRCGSPLARRNRSGRSRVARLPRPAIFGLRTPGGRPLATRLPAVPSLTPRPSSFSG